VLAETYVFGKQLREIFSCGPLTASTKHLHYRCLLQAIACLNYGAVKMFALAVRGQTLSRSYGRYIAEFLNEESLVHLGLLDLSTCVGLRYGR
jgi:hypothetical protein